MPHKNPFQNFNFNKIFGKITVSSILKDMIYLIGILIVAIVALAIFNPAVSWIIMIFFLFLGAVIIFFGYCYNYLMHKNPDLLRSESYQLNKQQLEMMGTKNKELTAQAVEAQIVTERPREISDGKKYKIKKRRRTK